MKKRLAIFDLGTNTFNLLVVDLKGGKFSKVYTNKQAVKLGQGGLSDGFLKDDAQKRAFMSIKDSMTEIANLGTDLVVAIGTSALRSAKNGPQFIKRVEDQLNLEIEVVDGIREAELVYKGVKYSGILNEDIDLIMDIGGGSVEFIIASNNEVKELFSFRTGVARLLHRFDPSDPIKEEEIKAIYDDSKKAFQPLFEKLKEYKIHRFIGSSGSFDSILEMLAAKKGISKRQAGNVISYEDYSMIRELIIKATKDERFKLPGLIPMRVDYIVMAVILISLVMEEVGINVIHQCDYSLKEGVLAENLNL